MDQLLDEMAAIKGHRRIEQLIKSKINQTSVIATNRYGFYNTMIDTAKAMNNLNEEVKFIAP
ncbi:hypothetical protein [Legionella gresilensis]|uniref:hypothetical protein n=1 Tax=Legionella gresilensis TaxID=91823 RepID=UPI001041248E|nr:hypothetical protein [Legionella gresilensis]